VRLGLRERLVAVLAVASALTLIVAALALFRPLDTLVRRASRDSLAQSLRGEIGDFTALPASAVRTGDPRLRTAMLGLRRTGAEVAVIEPDGRVIAATDPDPHEWAGLARRVRRAGDGEYRAVRGDGSEAAVMAAYAVRIGGVPVVVGARRRLEDVEAVTGVVRRAFVVAGVAGLLVVVLSGVLFARRLSRRLKRLRDTAERVAQVGPVAEFQPDDGRDEVGDLSRTFGFMQRRLREQEQVRRSFVATASHELRTPVTSLQVMLDLLISDLESRPPALGDALRQARGADEQAARLSQLASELLDLSRIDAGVPLRREPVELGEVLRSVVAELDVRLAGQRRSVAIADGVDGWACGDPGNVARILRILLDNALRHAPPPGGVRAELALRNGRAGVAIADDGPGVPAEDRDRIFERFARGRDAEAGGFGLGLAIGRELARRMDGDLVLEDTPAGARFVLWLPRSAAP
jgi:signal transduction histidine kinase